MKKYPAIGLIEYAGIAAGTRATDALTKKAPVQLIRVGSLQPGKFAVLFAGDVASVEESYITGLQVGAETVVDRVLLPDVAEDVYSALEGRVGSWQGETVGIIETSTLAATIAAADAGVKGANVEMVQIRLGDGLGGKGLAYFGGLLADIEAAIQIGLDAARREGRTICTAIIPRVDADVRTALRRSTRFAESD